MKILTSTFVSTLLVAALWSGAAMAEDEIVTVTGQIIVVEADADGDEIVKIVTETDEFLVHKDSTASDVSGSAGKNVMAKGTVEVTETSKTISVVEFAVIEAEEPPVGAK
jgi:hypothetical protein